MERQAPPSVVGYAVEAAKPGRSLVHDNVIFSFHAFDTTLITAATWLIFCQNSSDAGREKQFELHNLEWLEFVFLFCFPSLVTYNDLGRDLRSRLDLLITEWRCTKHALSVPSSFYRDETKGVANLLFS